MGEILLRIGAVCIVCVFARYVCVTRNKCQSGFDRGGEEEEEEDEIMIGKVSDFNKFYNKI